MSVKAKGTTHTPESSGRKRKLNAIDTAGENAELEVDLNAPEPPSKKALRKAKKEKAAKDPDPVSKPSDDTEEPQYTDAAAATSRPRSEYGIWIGNLAFTVTKEDLRNFLIGNSQIKSDQITRIHLPEGAPVKGPAKAKARNKGFAYVDLSTEDALQQALELSEKLLVGRRLLIKDSKSFEGRPEKTDQKTSSSNSLGTPSQKLFVGNLGFDVTVEDLEEHFSRCGPVAHVHAATFEDSGKCKGYAWVEFEDIESAEAAARGWVNAVDDDDYQDKEGDRTASKPKSRSRRIWVNKLKGRQLRMEFAEDKTTRYQKRFGKNAKKRDAETGADGVVEDPAAATDEEPVKELESPSQEHRAPARQATRAPTKTVKNAKSSGYDRATVQKLTGSIVEGQGKKITFD